MKAECESAIHIFNMVKAGSLSASTYKSYQDRAYLLVTPELPFLPKFANKIRDNISFLSRDIEIDWCKIVEWTEGASQEYHRDTASADTALTSITYLTDDFDGGETCFLDDIKVVPKIGRTVYFDGNHYVHGVSEITRGTRYTLPIWYKSISVV